MNSIGKRVWFFFQLHTHCIKIILFYNHIMDIIRCQAYYGQVTPCFKICDISFATNCNHVQIQQKYNINLISVTYNISPAFFVNVHFKN